MVYVYNKKSIEIENDTYLKHLAEYIKSNISNIIEAKDLKLKSEKLIGHVTGGYLITTPEGYNYALKPVDVVEIYRNRNLFTHLTNLSTESSIITKPLREIEISKDEIYILWEYIQKQRETTRDDLKKAMLEMLTICKKYKINTKGLVNQTNDIEGIRVRNGGKIFNYENIKKIVPDANREAIELEKEWADYFLKKFFFKKYNKLPLSFVSADISRRNVIVSFDDLIKIVDWGNARIDIRIKELTRIIMQDYHNPEEFIKAPAELVKYLKDHGFKLTKYELNMLNEILILEMIENDSWIISVLDDPNHKDSQAELINILQRHWNCLIDFLKYTKLRPSR